MQKEPLSSIDLTSFMSLRRHLKIVHHTPGRVRLRVEVTLIKELKWVDVGLFDRIIKAVEGVRDVRVNRAAASVVINYTPAVIESAWWERLLQAEEHQAMPLLKRLVETNLAPAVAVAQER